MSDKHEEEEKRPEGGNMIEPLRQALYARDVSPVLPAEITDEDVRAFYDELITLRNFIIEVAQGILSGTLPLKGYTAGAIKTLQANLRHLTWQTKMIASGDFTQRLDFMGEFSEAFNSMTVQLQKSMKIIKEKEEELNAINAGLLHEIEMRKRTQAALAESEAHYRNLTETMKDVVWILDTETFCISYISPSVEKLTGFTQEEVQGQTADILLAPQSFQKIKSAIKSRLAGLHSGKIPLDHYYTYELEHHCKNGSTVWGEIVAHYVRNPKTNKLELHIVSRDITDRRELQMELQRRATIDALTGIYNRRTFLEQAESEIRRSRRNRQPMAFLMLDLDHFKNVNDSFGHAMGDTALQKVAATCSSLLRPADQIGRMGGEEFAIYLAETDLYHAAKVAERLREHVALIDLTTSDGQPIPLRVSIGVSEFQADSDQLTDLINRADQALYQAKRSGRNQVALEKKDEKQV